MWTEADTERLVELACAGMSKREAAKHLGFTFGKVKCAAARAGLDWAELHAEAPRLYEPRPSMGKTKLACTGMTDGNISAADALDRKVKEAAYAEYARRYEAAHRRAFPHLYTGKAAA